MHISNSFVGIIPEKEGLVGIMPNSRDYARKSPIAAMPHIRDNAESGLN